MPGRNRTRDAPGGQPGRRRLGLGVLPGHERRRAPGRDRAAALGERPGQLRGELTGPRVHGVPAVGGEHVVGGERARHGLQRDGGGVVAARVGARARVEAGGRVGEVGVGRAERGQALPPGGSDPEHPAAHRPAQPLLARARVERAPQRADVGGDRADALGAVEQDGDVGREVGEALGPQGAGDPAHVRARHEPRGRADRVGQLGEGGRADAHAAARAQRHQRAEQAGMLVGRGQDLVVRAELEPGEDAHEALARARRQRDVGGRAPSSAA